MTQGTTSGRGSLAIGSLAAMLGVALGAFGAHALEGVLSPERLAVWETAVRYQMAHALGMLLVGVLAVRESSPWLRATAVCHTTGLVIFPGSLYLLCLTDIGVFGAVTPVGGVLWVIGWGLLAVHALRA
ncbi:DUF423 domain-containing protein [Arhodomonas sp. SL1]|uniref:DUF423 domain-containing protein n=1 Tax=Arhodomonas sp. SL1 TaxID=3425691 RepID=UPI003F881D05